MKRSEAPPPKSSERPVGLMALSSRRSNPETRKRKKKNGPGRAAINRLMAEVSEMSRTGNWDGATTPAHYLALWCLVHDHVYGSRPTELVNEQWLGALSALKKLLRDECGGRYDVLRVYIRYFWRREKDRQEWRHQNGKPPHAITWRDCFVDRRKWREFVMSHRRKRQGA